MTNTSTNQTLDTFKQAVNERRKLDEIEARRKNSLARQDIQSGTNDRTQYAYELFTRNKGNNEEPFVSIDETKINSPSDLNEAEVEGIFKFGYVNALKQPVNLLREKAREVIGGLSNKGLEFLVGSKSIISKVESADRTTFAGYMEVQKWKSAKEAYESGRGLANREDTKEISAMVSQAVSEGIEKKTEASLRDKYDIDQINIAKELAIIALKSGHIKEDAVKAYALQGFESRIAEVERAYNDSIRNERNIYAIVKDAAEKAAVQTIGEKEQAELAEQIYESSKLHD